MDTYATPATHIAERPALSAHAQRLQTAMQQASCPNDSTQFEAHLENLLLAEGAARAREQELVS